MTMLTLTSHIQSAFDNTVKYTFMTVAPNAQAIEFSYINKNDGKHIICVPTQTSCNMGCKFCHLTGLNIPVRNLTAKEIQLGMNHVVKDQALMTRPQTLLTSYMGCGEPLNNIRNVIESAVSISQTFCGIYFPKTRFAISTMVPEGESLHKFSVKVEEHCLDFKVHLSLHSPFDRMRQNLMPSACGVEEALFALRAHKIMTGNAIEIHYTLIDSVNDSAGDLLALLCLLQHDPIPIKFLAYNSKPDTPFKRSRRLREFMQALQDRGIPCEYYLPPGSDIGSSCGQFLTDNLRTT